MCVTWELHALCAAKWDHAPAPAHSVTLGRTSNARYENSSFWEATFMHEVDDWSSRAAASDAQAHADSNSADVSLLASIALCNCPAWTGDLMAGLPREADIVSDSTRASEQAEEGSRMPQRLTEGATAQGRQDMVSECPLHTAMWHLAEAAVAQHVLYIEGEVRSRPDLVNTISRWEHMHRLIRECICPATREISVGASAVAAVVDNTLDGMFPPGQRHLEARFVQALEACAACASTAECPLGATPDIHVPPTTAR